MFLYLFSWLLQINLLGVEMLLEIQKSFRLFLNSESNRGLHYFFDDVMMFNVYGITLILGSGPIHTITMFVTTCVHIIYL